MQMKLAGYFLFSTLQTQCMADGKMEQKWNRRATSVNQTYCYRLEEREVALESTNLASRGTPLGPNGMVTNHALYRRVEGTRTG